jgi:hypothetical protein
VRTAPALLRGEPLVFAGVLGGVSGVAVHILCARVLGPLSYGAFGSLVSATAAGEVWRFSTQVRTTSEVASGVSSRHAVSSVIKRMALSTPLLVITCFLIATYASVGGYVAASTGVLFVLSSVWSAGRRGAALGAGVVKNAANGLVICAVARVFLSVVGALLWGVAGAMAGGAVAEILGGLAVRLPGNEPRPLLESQVKSNWGVMSGLSLSPPGADVLVMTSTMNAASASSYAAASAFSRGALVVGQLLLLSYLPVLYSEGRNAFVKKGRRAIIVAGALASLGCVGAPVVLSLFVSSSIVSISSFTVGILSVVCGAYVNMTSYSMLSRTKKSLMTVSVAWSGIVSATVLAFIFRPSDAATGSLLLGVSSAGAALFAYIFSRRVS